MILKAARTKSEIIEVLPSLAAGGTSLASARIQHTIYPERFHSKIKITGGCWLWTATRNKGYGMYKVGGAYVRAHRWAYILLFGEVPHGLVLDHVCHSNDKSCLGGQTCLHRSCVNPLHLEPVTIGENVRRGRAALVRSSKMHCPKGHPYAGVNLKRLGNRRICKACEKATWLRYYYKHRSPVRKLSYGGVDE